MITVKEDLLQLCKLPDSKVYLWVAEWAAKYINPFVNEGELKYEVRNLVTVSESLESFVSEMFPELLETVDEETAMSIVDNEEGMKRTVDKRYFIFRIYGQDPENAVEMDVALEFIKSDRTCLQAIRKPEELAKNPVREISFDNWGSDMKRMLEDYKTGNF